MVTSKPDLMKTSDLVVYINNGTADSGSYNDLMAENSEFRYTMEKFEQEKSIVEFEPGMVNWHSHKWRKNHKFIGLDMDEVETTEITISGLPHFRQTGTRTLKTDVSFLFIYF